MMSPDQVAATEKAAQRDRLILAWQEADRALEIAKAAEIAARNLMVNTLMPQRKEGINTLELGMGYELKVTQPYSYSLKNKDGETDAMLEELEKIGNEGKFLADNRVVTWSPKLAVKEYRDLAPLYRKIVDTVLTITPGTPSVELKKPKGV